jgi:uncharacterized protein YbjT (DUF2867 family)
MSNKLIGKMKEIERDAVLRIMEEAKRTNITRLIYMSGYEMRGPLLDRLKIPEFGAIKIEIESAITKSDFNWTILGDAPSFEIFFAFLRGNTMAVPGGGYKQIPAISADDVGEITAQAAMRTDLNKMRLKLTGPQAYSFPVVAKLISDITGNKIKHIAIPLPVFNFATFLLSPFAPFLRYLYKSIKMFNNFPEDLASNVPKDHKILRELFTYDPVTLDDEIRRRFP